MTIKNATINKAAAAMLCAAFAVAGGGSEALGQPFPRVAAKTVPAASPNCASRICLAYVSSSSVATNRIAQRGLDALAEVLKTRTAVEPAGTVALDIERMADDELAPYPFIYWPVEQSVQPLSERAQARVQKYINTGGVIVFDLYDQSSSSSNPAALRRLLGNVGVKSLAPMARDHTLTKSFYLVSGLPGSRRGTVWVEAPGAANGKIDDVSSVVIGSGNWAAAWAGASLPAGSPERELALRAGVNMVMFALMGNYKEDQLHMPTILQKLGK